MSTRRLAQFQTFPAFKGLRLISVSVGVAFQTFPAFKGLRLLPLWTSKLPDWMFQTFPAFKD
jgi:hypothetical protein